MYKMLKVCNQQNLIKENTPNMLPRIKIKQYNITGEEKSAKTK